MTLSELTALVRPDQEIGERVELRGGPPDMTSPLTFWYVSIEKVISRAMVVIEAGPNTEPEHAIAMAAERYRAAEAAA